ncbi:MAG TPA: type I methionyl aminopeptidase [Candidatus Dormibacteraeota bacterium]|nr:type I methionyl aminopeptidase [Candidatus Dormibacteraeota bacterium]
MITLKRQDEVELMRQAGRRLAEVLDHLAGMVAPGVTTSALDRAANREIRRRDSFPGFLGYEGFPKHLCISVNDQVVHGIPDGREIVDGDIVSLDCGLVYQGWWADAGLTVACGEVDDEAARLIRVTREALDLGIAAAIPGNHLGDIGHAVQSHVEQSGFSIVRGYTGHGIGRDMHEAPEVPNHGSPGKGIEIRPGLCLAIEPIVNEGDPGTLIEPDGWTVITRDQRRSCYFEHTVAIGQDGVEVLTRLPEAV